MSVVASAFSSLGRLLAPPTPEVVGIDDIPEPPPVPPPVEPPPPAPTETELGGRQSRERARRPQRFQVGLTRIVPVGLGGSRSGLGQG